MVETVPSLILGVVTLLYLDDRVDHAKWLDAGEKRLIAQNIAREAQAKEGHSQLSAAFRTPRVWLLGLIYFTIASGIYIISFWLPTIIKQTGVADPLTIGGLTAIPYAVAVAAMILVNQSADLRRERRWHTAIPCLVTAAGLALTAASNGNTLVAMAGLTLGAAGVSTAQSSFWTLPASFLGGAAAAAGIALINALGNIGGFASTFLVGWMTDLTHSTASSLYLFGALIAVGAGLILTIPAALVNK